MILSMRFRTVLSAAVLLVSAGCTHTVKVEPPKEPIEINLNVKIEHEIRVKVEKDIEELLSEKENLF
jgi:hypothetical protein